MQTTMHHAMQATTEVIEDSLHELDECVSRAATAMRTAARIENRLLGRFRGATATEARPLAATARTRANQAELETKLAQAHADTVLKLGAAEADVALAYRRADSVYASARQARECADGAEMAAAERRTD